MINRLFVYGTLGPRQSHEHLLTQVSGRWEKASVRGHLYPKGIGATAGYPALELSEDGEVVNGHVYFSRQLSSLLGALDHYEGEGYQRVTTEAVLFGGKRIDAYVYILNGS